MGPYSPLMAGNSLNIHYVQIGGTLPGFGVVRERRKKPGQVTLVLR